MPPLDYQLSLLKIPVNDINRCAAFYIEHLKFKEEFVAEQYGWAQLSAGELPIALYKPGMGGGNGTPGGSTGFHLALPADQFDSLGAELLAKNLLVENRIHRGDDGSTFFQTKDPDGNVLNIGRML